MNPITYRFTLDAHKSGCQHTIEGVRKGDTRGRELFISLTENGRPYQFPDAEDCTVYFYAVKPDGTTVMNTCTIDNNRVYYVVSSQTIAAMGRVVCQITITGTNDSDEVIEIATPQFAIEVGENIETGEAIQSTDEMTVLQSIISAVSNMGIGVVTATYLDGENIDLTTMYDAGLYVVRGILNNYTNSPFGNNGKSFSLLVCNTYDDTVIDSVRHNCVQIAFGERITRRTLSMIENGIIAISAWQDFGDFEVLDKFSESDGQLLFDGNPIGGTSAFATPTIDGSTITLENNKEYNISRATDATIALPSAPGTTYSGTILLCLTCTADINLTFDASVKLDSGVSTVTGYHEILITFHPGEGKWWVRQTPEVT
jgi:hypothetical protein